MKSFYRGCLSLVVVLGASSAWAQQVAQMTSKAAQDAPTKVSEGQAKRFSATAKQDAPAKVSEGQAAIDKTLAAGKYAFIFFQKEKNQQTDKALSVLQPALAKLADKAENVTIRITDAKEKAVVDRYGVSHSPMPLVLAIAPNGAITKAFTGGFDEKQLSTAFVSPCEQSCMKAIQSSKMIFVCVVYEVAADGQAAIPQGVKDIQADEKYAKATEIVTLNVADKKEAGFLKELQIDAKAKKPVSVLLAPGALIGTFEAAATKEQIVAKITAAQSGCCPGGNCGPGGCGPKK